MAAPAKPRKGEPIRLVVTKTGEPRYRVVLDAEPSPDGKRRQIRSTHPNLSTARDFVRQWKADRSRGTLVAPEKQTFRQHAANWLAAREASSRTRATTITGYKTHVNTANAAFGDKALSKITSADVAALVSEYAAKGRTATSSAYLIRILRAIFREAIEDGVLVRNPAARVEAQGKPVKEREALTAAEVAKVRAWLAEDDQSKPSFACWLLTLYGLRRGEVMGLRWSDISLSGADPTIRIQRSRVRHGVGGQAEQVGAPKTKNGLRTLPIKDMPALVESLRALRKDQLQTFGAEQVRSGYLAVWPDGTPYPPAKWSKLWDAAVAGAKVKRVSLHAARHSSVTTMRDAGVPDHIVAEWHGHDENIMRRVYSHAHGKQLRGAGGALEGAYS